MRGYASREAVDLLLDPGRKQPAEMLSGQARLKRFVKAGVYARLPIGIRAAGYFAYRYFLRLGFLDGWQGFAFHFLQGFWYRFLVDVKVYELRKVMESEGLSLEAAVRREFGLDISPDRA